MSDEGVLDPFVKEWLEANPIIATPLAELSPDLLALARSPIGAPPTREIAKVTDDVVDGVPLRLYEHESAPMGLVV